MNRLRKVIAQRHWGINVNVVAESMVKKLVTLFVSNAGVATTEQLLAIGLSPERLSGLVRRGLLTPVRRSVYTPTAFAERIADKPPQQHARRVAAEIVVSSTPGLLASHTSAAVIHGLALLNDPPAERVTMTQSSRGTGSRSGQSGVHTHTASVPASHQVRRFGVPVTTVARTVIDIARHDRFIEGVVVADDALHAEKTTRGALDAVLEQCAGWPGIAKARRVVEFSDARAESVLESAARVIMHEHGLEPPQLQVDLGNVGTGWVGRVDFYWPQHRTIVEVDGKGKYANKNLAVNQLRRDSRLRAAGFEVVHFTWADIMYDPERVITEILDAFDRARRLG
jgi:predicted transcriptional regulator of viral defense system